ncbi:MAG: thermonuclease family protein [Pseudomonadota bacterium]
MRGFWKIAVICALIPFSAAQAETLEGKPVLIDGDSIVVDGKPVRLWGIDAPEMDTRAGYLAKRYLRTVVEDRSVRCVDEGMRAGTEIMAKCYIGEVDLGEIMVLSGHARDWTQYSQGYYSR